MSMTRLVPVLAILALSAGEARACGRRCGCRRGQWQAVVARPSVAYAPVADVAPPMSFVGATAPEPWPADAPQAAVQVPQAAPAGGAEPLYTYEASPENGVAYYYTYDDSGKLVVRQWMDWLFRGGRRAGLPAPPLPIVGRLGN